MLALVGVETGALAGVAFGLADPVRKRLRRTADLGSNRLDSRSLRRILAGMIESHAHGTLTHLG